MNSEIVLFVHSTGTGPFLWSSVPGAALHGLPALYPANLGYAPREPVARGTTVTAADDARAVLAEVPPSAERIHVVAHSYGATVALDLVEPLGPRLASLFLYEPVLFGALGRDGDALPEAAAEARAFAAHPWFLHDESRGGSDEWLEVFVDYWNRPGAWRKMPEPVRAMTRAVAWKMYQEVRACFADACTFAEWTLPRATTLCRGCRSPLASRAMTDALTREHPHAVRVELPDLGHMAPLTTPAPVHTEIDAHLARARS